VEIKWTPAGDIEDLIEELNEIKGSMDEQDWKSWADENYSQLPSAPIPPEADTSYPIWAMDNDGYCLVGDSADMIEHIGSIMEIDHE